MNEEGFLSKIPASRFAAVILATLVLGGGCARQSPQQPEQQQQAASSQVVPVKQAPPTPIEARRVQTGGPSWDPGWDTIIERSVPAAMVSSQAPRDVQRFCPQFFTMSETDRRAYWAYFFQALAGAEAGLDTRTDVHHPSRTIRAEGLLQLNYEDAERYSCNFDPKADSRLPLRDPNRTILKPENNLACGINILNQQVIGQHKPLFARSSYWSTLHPGNGSYRVFAKQMTNPPAACGFHPNGTGGRSQDR